MVLKMLVYCRTRFVAFHQWKDAPDEFAYLRNVHRHEFHVEVGARVQEGNREVEFHRLKEMTDELIKSATDFEPEAGVIEASCESMAVQLGHGLRTRYGYDVAYVDVSEDGECGGRVIYE